MEELREIDHKKSEFICNISHELRTPVQSIKGFSELMLDDEVDDPERQKEFLNIISAGSERLSRLISNLLSVSHLEVGYSGGVQKERVSIRRLLQEAISDLHSPAEQKDIAISAKIPAALPEMEVDGERLKQVMHNLLNNAIKFSPGGGTITVGVEVKDGNLLVQVIDRGVGIAQEAMPRVFEKFYQTEEAAKVEGLGLGLYISKQIIEAHGGRIWATSKVGEGSTFGFTLPLGQAGGDSHTQEGEKPLQGEKR
jgi:signal transduction histidine kinase